jgi:hypothetical protein
MTMDVQFTSAYAGARAEGSVAEGPRGATREPSAAVRALIMPAGPVEAATRRGL